MAAIQVDNDRDRYRGFRRRDGDDKNGEEYSIQFTGIEVFIERNKVDVNAVKDKFNAHQHRDHIAPGEQAVHANKKQRCTYE
jgi:hypothetical protein